MRNTNDGVLPECDDVMRPGPVPPSNSPNPLLSLKPSLHSVSPSLLPLGVWTWASGVRRASSKGIVSERKGRGLGLRFGSAPTIAPVGAVSALETRRE